MARVVVNEERCKGCELCVAACPKSLMKLQDRINAAGYHIAACNDEGECIACAACAKMCPDTAIEVFDDKEKKK